MTRPPARAHPARQPSSLTTRAKAAGTKNTVTVSFTSNGDPKLADGSARERRRTATLTSPETFNTSGPINACGTVEDKVGNESPKAA